MSFGRQRAASRARPGVALVMAVVAMAVLGVLVAGVFFTALREQRDGRAAVHRVQALAVAEYGLASALSPDSWRPSWNLAERRGPLFTFTYAPGPDASDSVHLLKLDRNSFLLLSAGVAGPSIAMASRRIGLLVTLRTPLLAARSAVIAMEAAVVSDSSLVSGTDTVPPVWNCPPADEVRPAMVVADESLVDEVACTIVQCIAGAPPIGIDSAAAGADMYWRFGAVDRDSIAAAAVQLADDAFLSAPAPALDGAGECDAARLNNLGDPSRFFGAESPCADYFPVLHAPGNMRIDGGVGQGTLLVDGNLTIAGGARFHGVVAVGGVLEITDLSELHGAALASRVIVHGGSRVRYSSCAVERALRAAAMPVVPEGLTWSDMY